MRRLCGLHDGFKGAVGLGPAHVLVQRPAEDGELSRGFEAADGLVRFQHARGGRAQRFCFSRSLYKERDRVDRFSDKIKQLRRIATGYEKLGANLRR